MKLFDYRDSSMESYTVSGPNGKEVERFHGLLECSSDNGIVLKRYEAVSKPGRKLKHFRCFTEFRDRPDDTCIYCSKKMPRVFHDRGSVLAHGWFSNNVWRCRDCGWWSYVQHSDLEGWDHAYYDVHKHRAIIRRFDVCDRDVPVYLLNQVIRRRPGILHQINPIALEKLVAATFRQFYACEVVHCGRSHDNGIDLVLVDSDSPTVVQIKRRSKHESVEPVSIVREFIGAMMVGGSQRGIFVSTANRFSAPAQEAASKVVEIGAIETLELVACEQLKEMLSRNHLVTEEPWVRAIDHPPFSEVQTS